VTSLGEDAAVEEYFEHIETHLFSSVVTNIEVSRSPEEREGYIGNFSRLAVQYYYLRTTLKLEPSEKIEKIIKLGFKILTDVEKDVFQDPYKRRSRDIKFALPEFISDVKYNEVVRECLLWMESL
jgi:hypothetical protein